MSSVFLTLSNSSAEFLKALKEKNDQEIKNISSSPFLSLTQKQRKKFVCEIFFFLVVGAEEIREEIKREKREENNNEEKREENNSKNNNKNDKENNIKNDIKNDIKNEEEEKNKNNNKNDDNNINMGIIERIRKGLNIENICKDLASKIEQSVYDEFNKDSTDNSLSFSYKKRLLEFYAYLADAKNFSLRKNIIIGNISPEKMASLTADELAPVDEVKKREEQQKKFFKEQVYVPEDMKLVAINLKNSEGEVGNQNEKKENGNVNMENAYVGVEKEKPKKSKEKVVKGSFDKFKGVPSDLVKFYFELEEFKTANVRKKLAEICKEKLRPETISFINKKRNERKKKV